MVILAITNVHMNAKKSEIGNANHMPHIPRLNNDGNIIERGIKKINCLSKDKINDSFPLPVD